MKVVVVGAGLAGSMLAALLVERGHEVEVVEQRTDPRTGADRDRSINLGISARGIRALRRIGLWEALQPSLVPMRGRAVHLADGRSLATPYGTGPSEVLHSVRRAELNERLVQRARGARFTFGVRCTGLADGVLTLTDPGTGRTSQRRPDLVVGADGAFSAVRRLLQHGRPADHRQQVLEWGYKELTVPPGASIPLEALNVWPSAHGLVVAHPNPDGSHTGTLFLPHEGEPGFSSLDTPGAVLAFFREHLPRFAALVPDLADQFLARPVGHLVTVRTAPWHAEGRVVLVGDAAHAIYPFYGQGMNASLEDCLVLDECLASHPEGAAGRAAALAAFQQRRKPHTDVLAELSAQNFVELRDGTRSPLRLARSRADHTLSRLFPRRWLPLYTMVSHTTIPYGDALRRARRQDRAFAAAALTASTAVVGIGAAALASLRRERP
ncbi:MAG: FAD-dependent monooxygenase [Pseudonocardia sp.]|nr:FAD-dependent monooxygenase [Pseudonocardia sp.]